MSVFTSRSRGTWRQWPPQHFALLADICYQHGYKIFLTGTEEEKPLTETVGNLTKSPHINLAGKTNLGALGVLISNASLQISNCTGVSHMAAALKTPSIVISMDGEPERWAPLDTSIHKTTN
ncbi:MAG: glycosyltransferase family 9 protein [Flavobacterium sp.]|nr:glycosyltransferase family 9 protein [Pedobacter sp.]